MSSMVSLANFDILLVTLIDFGYYAHNEFMKTKGRLKFQISRSYLPPPLFVGLFFYIIGRFFVRYSHVQSICDAMEIPHIETR